MECAKCHATIAAGFYCISCGNVPPRASRYRIVAYKTNKTNWQRLSEPFIFETIRADLPAALSDLAERHGRCITIEIKREAI